MKEDDYLDYALNFPMVSTLIQSLIMNHTLLFVGYSLGDSTFNSIFRLIQNTFKLDAKFAYFYTPEEPSMIIREYYKNKALSLFLTKLLQLKKWTIRTKSILVQRDF